MKRIIVYHKNCMDGVSAAFITKTAISTYVPDESDIITLPLHYGDEDKLFTMINESEEPCGIYMVDFSFKEAAMSLLLSNDKVTSVLVLDHHKTAEEQLANLTHPKFKFVYDVNKSGAMVCYDYFKDMHCLAPDIFEYIQDRDLWRWDLPNSKEISEYLQFTVDTNDLDSFKDVAIEFMYNKHNLVAKGELLLSSKMKSVDGKKYYAQTVTINGIDFKILNATENVSELGNAICELYDMPAVLFFFGDDFNPILSFRSMNHLPDVSEVAKSFPGGGGHRNAAGAKVTMNKLVEILNTKKE